MNAINHPSYANTGCTEQDVHRAINDSIAADGAEQRLNYSETAARILAQECDWESEEDHTYRGTDIDGRPWEVALYV